MSMSPLSSETLVSECRCSMRVVLVQPLVICRAVVCVVHNMWWLMERLGVHTIEPNNTADLIYYLYSKGSSKILFIVSVS